MSHRHVIGCLLPAAALAGGGDGDDAARRGLKPVAAIWRREVMRLARRAVEAMSLWPSSVAFGETNGHLAASGGNALRHHRFRLNIFTYVNGRPPVRMASK